MPASRILCTVSASYFALSFSWRTLFFFVIGKLSDIVLTRFRNRQQNTFFLCARSAKYEISFVIEHEQPHLGQISRSRTRCSSICAYHIGTHGDEVLSQ